MTQLEAAGIALANEVEANIRLGVSVTTALVNAVDQFRKMQVASDKLLDANLDAMYKRYEAAHSPKVTNIMTKRLKVVKDEKN